MLKPAQFATAFVCSTAVFLLSPISGHAQVDPVTMISAGSAVLGAITVKKIFSDIQQTLDQAQKSAESTGNRLLASGVEQSYEMLKQLQSDLNDDLDKTFNNVSDQRKLAVFDLYTMSNELANKVANSVAAEQVQMDKALGEVRFLGKDVGFLIVRVFPTLFFQKSISSKPIQIYGVGFGSDQGDKQFKTEISVGGTALNPSADVELKEWGIQVNLSAINSTKLFSASKYNHVPMVINTSVTSAGSWWCSWAGCKTTKSYSSTYHLDFYPSNAAQLTAKQQDTISVGNGQFNSVEILDQLPDMNNAGHLASTSTPATYAGDGWKWDHYDQAHDRSENAGGIDGRPFVRNPTCRFFNDNTQVQCTADNDGGPVHYYFAVVKQQYIAKANHLPDVSFLLRPGETQRIQIQKTASSAWIEGVLPNGENVGPITLKPPGGSALAPVICTSAGDVGDKSNYDCQMPYPQ